DMKEALRPLVEASASGIREIARAGFHAGASWALLPSCPAAPPCPPYPPCPACFCTCGEGGGGGGAPAAGGGGGGSPPWLTAAGGPVCDALADALVGALREAVEGCVGWGAAIALVLLALLAGFGLGRLSLAASARLEARDGAGAQGILVAASPGVQSSGALRRGDLWHERILLYPAASEASGAGLPGACWVVYTPDHDMYIEELEGGSPDDSPVEWLEMPRDLRLPSGLGRAYRFDESPTEEVMKGLYRRAFSAAQADAEARGVLLEAPTAVRTAAGRDVAVHEVLGANFFGGRRMTGKRPPLGLDLGGDRGGHAGPAAAAAEALGDSGPPGPAVEGTSTPRSSGRVWRAAEADERCRIALGDELGPPAHSLCGKGLCLAAPGRAVVVHLTGLDQDSFVMSLRGGEGHPFSAGAENGGGGDARTLTVKSGPRGRGREWREVVDACEEEPFSDFPVEHEQLIKYIGLAGTHDQLDLSNCAFAEAIFRRAQTIEWSYHDRLRGADSASSKDKMSPGEFSAFSGFSKAGDLLMVAPALLEFVKGQVEKDAAIMKNIRKAREERELRRKGALRELRGAGVCEDIDSPVVSFDDSLVSLPEAGNVPVPLGELVAGVGDLDVEAAMHEQLLPRKDAESNLSEAPRQPYMDAILRAQPRAYAGLVRRLHTAGMVAFSAAPRERCGLFFVRKKSGKQRMVIDCRRANCWFKRPSTVALATGSALGELAVPEGEQLYVGHVDICDAFYHFGLPEAFRDYFALPAVKAGDVGLTVLGGRSLAPGSRVWPVLAVLPMGWKLQVSWSSKVMCTDASFWGFGLVCKDLDKDLVGSMGCFSERWRFLGDSKVLSRAWAAGSSEDEIMTKPLESSKDFSMPAGCLASGTSPTVLREGCGTLDTLVLESARLERRQAAAPAGEARSVPRTRPVLPSQATSAPSLRRLLCDDLAGSPPLSEARAPPAADKVKRGELARRGAKLAEAGTLDVLRLSTVRTQTVRSRFQQLAAEFDEWLAEQGLPARPTFSLDERRMIPLAPQAAAELDCSLAEWMLGQYLEGVDHWRGVQMLAALQWSHPRLGRDGGARLPGARQSLRGWKVLTPPLTRLPLPEEVVAALACELVSMGLWEAAACVVLSMVFYMRPGEWGRVRVKHAIAPRASGSQALRQWALVLHPHDGEEARPSKTAEFDESLVQDLTCDLWLGGVLRRLTAAKPPDAALFSFSVEGFAEIFRRAARRLGLEPALMPYLLRHSGASRDFVNGLRPLSEVKRRGRWKTDASVRRYEKGAVFDGEPFNLSTVARAASRLACQIHAL
ncbi:unnamed protein product, partial [Prorocentrum cordatum]